MIISFHMRLLPRSQQTALAQVIGHKKPDSSDSSQALKFPSRRDCTLIKKAIKEQPCQQFKKKDDWPDDDWADNENLTILRVPFRLSNDRCIGSYLSHRRS